MAHAQRQRPGRAALARFVVPVLLGAAGIVVLVADGPRSLAGWMLVGLGLVVATSLAFLEVGLSEDRERAAERRPGRSRRPRT